LAVSRTYRFDDRMPEEDFLGDVLRFRAIVFRDMGSFDEALASLQRALDRKPGYANAAVFRSQLIRGISGYEHLYAQALAAIDRAIALHPDSPEVPDLSMERANLLLAMDRREEARKMLVDSARFESSGNGAFFNGRSSAWKTLGEFDKAASDIARAMSIDQWFFQTSVESMEKSGYLMSWPGLDPQVAMANAIVACSRDPSC
jgi:tetratricopeptide (TPR) repeat protein